MHGLGQHGRGAADATTDLRRRHVSHRRNHTHALLDSVDLLLVAMSNYLVQVGSVAPRCAELLVGLVKEAASELLPLRLMSILDSLFHSRNICELVILVVLLIRVIAFGRLVQFQLRGTPDRRRAGGVVQ